MTNAEQELEQQEREIILKMSFCTDPEKYYQLIMKLAKIKERLRQLTIKIT